MLTEDVLGCIIRVTMIRRFIEGLVGKSGGTEVQSGLPVVTRSTIESIFQSDKSGERRWGEKLEDTKKRMIVEQPVLVKFLEGQVGGLPAELHGKVFEVVVGMYSVLEQQANANDLNSRFQVSDEKKNKF